MFTASPAQKSARNTTVFGGGLQNRPDQAVIIQNGIQRLVVRLRLEAVDIAGGKTQPDGKRLGPKLRQSAVVKTAAIAQAVAPGPVADAGDEKQGRLDYLGILGLGDAIGVLLHRAAGVPDMKAHGLGDLVDHRQADAAQLRLVEQFAVFLPAMQHRQRIEFPLDGPVRANHRVSTPNQPDAHDALQGLTALLAIGHVQTRLHQAATKGYFVHQIIHTMKRLAILTPLVALAATFTFPGVVFAQPSGDDVLLQMQQAARKQDGKTLAALLPATQGHPLEVWAQYWELKARLDNATGQEVESFLQRWHGTYLEDRLRNDWLLLLGQRREWAEFERLHSDFRMQDDKQLRCYDLAIASMEGRLPAQASTHLQQLWLDQPANDDGCTYAASTLHAAQQLPTQTLWLRARLGAERNQLGTARNALAIAAPQQAGQLAALFKSPLKYLTTGKATPPAALATLALIRLAVNDPDQTAQLLRTQWQKKLSAEERHWVWGVIGKTAARRLSDDALDYFAEVQQLADLDDDTLAWLARAALRAGQWPQVRQAIAAMSEAQQQDSTWVYWKARALLAQGTPQGQEQAQALLDSIAGVGGFYEQLAAEDLGRTVLPPPEPQPPTAQEAAQARANPGLARALYAIRIGLRSEGVREWNYTTNLHQPGGMNDRELLAAAQLACQAQVWDRCINTSERTRGLVSWQQRYPMPFKDEVVTRARNIGLDPAYVYGLIRQESRFIMDARSHVGASGLMQVMPATAKWTAKKIGMTGFQPAMINQHDVNITIGTAYLKLALDDFDGSMVLAAAGYNAGPGRPRNWRNGPVLDAAIWAENVPFTETRDYVKKVLANTTNYAAAITGQPQSLRSRLGQVGPKDTPVAYNRDLP